MEKIFSWKGGMMARDPKIKRRLVCNWDEVDKMFYCIVQQWDNALDRYIDASYFEVEKTEINKDK
tara:strand:- start:535 stop:729 length:195 start_codon:yes stop_codon:yes gene_type:complete